MAGMSAYTRLAKLWGTQDFEWLQGWRLPLGRRNNVP